MTDKLLESVDRAVIDLVDWAKKRPAWQIDALIRIPGGPLGVDEISDLADRALEESQSPAKHKPVVSAEKLSVATSDTPAITLKSISNTQNVNKLAPNQVLTFIPSGLTVIYGSNGTGKSGYTRVLRQVCQVRGAPGPVLPNIYADSSASPRATITWSGGSSDQTCEWTTSGAGADDLKAISIFDSKAADHHIHQGAAAAYTPEALRLLESLGDVLRRVEEDLQERVRANEAAEQSLPSFHERSVLAELMSALGVDGTDSRLRSAAALDITEIKRFAELSQTLEEAAKSDPGTRMVSLNRLIAETRALTTNLTVLTKQLDDQQIAIVRNQAERVCAKETAAAASAKLLAGMELPELGGTVWKELWEAARRYSTTVAYPGHSFPHVEDDARCVLCQQSLSDGAVQRLVSLEEYVHDTAQQELDAVRREAQTTRDSIQRSSADAIRALQPSAELCEELGDTAFVTILDPILTAARCRLGIVDHLVSEPDTYAKAAPDNAVWDVTSVLAQMESFISEWDLEITKLAQLIDEEARAKVVVEHRTLQERADLGAHLEDVLKEHTRLSDLKKLIAAISTTNTRAVTQQHGKLSQKLVTEALREIFNEELRELGAGRLEVSIVRAKSANATSTFKLAFDGVDAKHPIGEVFSEGECRIIGLAGFMTELRYSRSRAAIVMDDPMSSLDHRYRAKVAKRLVAESLNRQVVVFTHDIAFLEQLNHYAPHAGANIEFLVLENTAAGTGTCSGTLPPYGANLKTRLGYVRNLLQRNEKHWKNKAEKEWREASETLVREMRKAWERAIEEVLFNDAVTRFERAVQTNRIREVSVDDEDWAAIENAMTELSRLGPHDEPQEAQDEPPSPDDIRTFLQDLEAWRDGVDKRRKATAKRRPKVSVKTQVSKAPPSSES